ncbi:MAG: hypothetical protein ACRYGL_20670 [Janthinobacterium lividum]
MIGIGCMSACDAGELRLRFAVVGRYVPVDSFLKLANGAMNVPSLRVAKRDDADG